MSSSSPSVSQNAFFDSMIWDGEEASPAASEEQADAVKVVDLKHCPGCNEYLSTNCFHKESSKKDGLYTYCKICTKDNRKKRRSEPEEATDELLETPCQSDSLYIMENSLIPGIVKIGRSVNPQERAKQLAALHPFKIVVQYSYGEKGFLEKTLHDQLKHRRVEGGSAREWFRITAEQADTLVKACMVHHELSKP